MFIKRTILKRLFKDAFKGKGLYIENDGEGYRFKGSYWDLWVRKERLPKEVKADVIELIGDLPEVGPGGTYNKEGCQIEIPGFECPKEMAKAPGDRTYIDTGMIIINERRETLRVMQAYDGEILLPYNHIMEAIRPEVIDFDNGESDVEGAFNPRDNILLFRNNVSTFVTFARRTEELQEFADEMKKMNLYRLIHPELPK